MKKRKTLKSRALVWILNFAMLVGLIQGNLLSNTVQAAGTGGAYETSGAHIHNDITFASWLESGSSIELSSGNSSGVGSLPTSIQNGSFELPIIENWYSVMPDSDSSIAWKTTASDHDIEFARPSENTSAANGAYHTKTAEDAVLLAKYQTISQNSDGTTRSYKDGNTKWKSYTGDYVVPTGQTETTFAFVSTETNGNNISHGNLLDNVYFSAEVPSKTQLFEYDATCGSTVNATVNGIAKSGKEAFVSVGSKIEFSQSANTGYTYNGGFVNGSYRSVDNLPIS